MHDSPSPSSPSSPSAAGVDESIVTKDGVIWCTKCNISLGAKWNKTVKQHHRSKLHKKGGQTNKSKKKGKKVHETDSEDEEDGEGEEGEDGEDGVADKLSTLDVEDKDIVCTLCHLMGESREHYPFSQTSGKYCLAPPVLDRPSIRETPFITKKGGNLPLYPDNLEEALQNYCVGKASRMPTNIDINHQCNDVTSLSHARKLLKEAHINKEAYWCALAIDDDVGDPDWWPEDNKVPGYTQLIIGSDVYGKSKLPVDTYLTICRGVKQVIMLPPGKNSLFIGKMPFPLDISVELLQKIRDLGGYYFEVKPFSSDEFAALFVPKGWNHWLLGKSDWAVGFGSSRF